VPVIEGLTEGGECRIDGHGSPIVSNICSIVNGPKVTPSAVEGQALKRHDCGRPSTSSG
jgi:hypothetical protein